MDKNMRNFREYGVWKDSMNLVTDVYSFTKTFPSSELYSLTNQIQRAAVSIPSNIAEGAGRQSNIDFAHFLDIALGSTFEVETQLQIANNLGYISDDHIGLLLQHTQTIEKELTNFIRSLKSSTKCD